MKVTIFTHNTSKQYFKALYYLERQGAITVELLDNVHSITKPHKFFQTDVLIPFYGPYYPQIEVAQIAKKFGIKNIFMNSWEKWQEGEYVKYYCPKWIWYNYLKDVECVSVSKKASNDIEPYVAKSYHIPHAIDTALFKPLNVEKQDDTINILFVGYLEKYKGIDKVLFAAKRLENENITFHFAGTGSYKDAIKKEKNCVYHGFIKEQKELVKLYNQCDILVQPSEFEKFGITMIEAMSCKLPIISTSTTGAQEIFDDEKGGIIMDPTNDEEILVEKLIENIRYLSESENVRKRIGEDGRKKVLSRYDVTASAQKWAKILKG